MVFLIMCKNEEDSSKNEGTRVVTKYLPLEVYGDFSNAKGQLTPQSQVLSCQISNAIEVLWLFSLPARIKKKQSKMKKLEWSQDFPHYNPLGAISCHGNQSSDLI